MGLLVSLLVGLIAGWLAGQVMKGGGYGVLVDILLGLVGGLVGGWLFGLLGLWPGGGIIGSIIVSFVGAVILSSSPAAEARVRGSIARRRNQWEWLSSNDTIISCILAAWRRSRHALHSATETVRVAAARRSISGSGPLAGVKSSRHYYFPTRRLAERSPLTIGRRSAALTAGGAGADRSAEMLALVDLFGDAQGEASCLCGMLATEAESSIPR